MEISREALQWIPWRIGVLYAENEEKSVENIEKHYNECKKNWKKRVEIKFYRLQSGSRKEKTNTNHDVCTFSFVVAKSRRDKISVFLHELRNTVEVGRVWSDNHASLQTHRCKFLCAHLNNKSCSIIQKAGKNAHLLAIQL